MAAGRIQHHVDNLFRHAGTFSNFHQVGLAQTSRVAFLPLQGSMMRLSESAPFTDSITESVPMRRLVALLARPRCGFFIGAAVLRPMRANEGQW
jgi:hypothetical protein